ncbi:MAG TPA: GIY-YIG nuclease family protein [candidate division Zixibacteria bacterium]|nr:GIY-YIG nuclease family protein [candidate division Zixibacteria bacterium]
MDRKKELKEQYRQMKPPMGVFQIRNLVNNRVFIDSGPDMKARWNRHRFQLNFGSHPNKTLQEDWTKQGEKEFVFEVLSELEWKTDGSEDYHEELQTLLDMTLDELNLDEGLIYR